MGACSLLVGGLAYLYYFCEASDARQPPAPPAATVTTARFRSHRGQREGEAGGHVRVGAAPTRSMVLRKSDLVRTGAGAAAEIAFFDGTVVHVRPDSLITIEETSEDPSTKRRRVAWHISSGEVNFQTVRKQRPRQRDRDLDADRAARPRASRRDGGIRVGRVGRQRRARLPRHVAGRDQERRAASTWAPSEALKVDAAGKAGAKQALPGVPALLAPPHQAEITYPDPARATTLLVWKPVPGAAAYHVMLDYSAYFNRPLVRPRGRQGQLDPAAGARHRQVLLAGGRGGQGQRGGRVLGLRALHGHAGRAAPAAAAGRRRRC